MMKVLYISIFLQGIVDIYVISSSKWSTVRGGVGQQAAQRVGAQGGGARHLEPAHAHHAHYAGDACALFLYKYIFLSFRCILHVTKSKGT